jgi:hypothetical protein
VTLIEVSDISEVEEEIGGGLIDGHYRDMAGVKITPAIS